jgi:peptidoglycan LD-endopeptidase CwlK
VRTFAELEKYFSQNMSWQTTAILDAIRGGVQMDSITARNEGSDGAAKAADPTRFPSHAVVEGASKFKLGAGSMKELNGVNGDLVRCVMLAITISPIDFCVYDGIRSVKEQQQHVKNGTSKTMQSKHLNGLAVDLVPWIGGKPVWDWKGCYQIAWAMDQAATQLGMADRITWGGAWDRRLSDFGGDLGSYEQEVTRYRSRHAGSDFLDGPHFEITRA